MTNELYAQRVLGFLGLIFLAAIAYAFSLDIVVFGDPPPNEERWEQRVETLAVDEEKLVEALTAMNATEETTPVSQPAADTFAMRYAGSLADIVSDLDYADWRRQFVAAEFAPDYETKRSILLPLTEVGQKPLVQQRAAVELASAILRLDLAAEFEEALRLLEVAEQASAALPKYALADPLLLRAEIALAERDFATAWDTIERSVAADPKFTTAHLLKLRIAEAIEPRIQDSVYAAFLDSALDSADFVRILSDKSFVLDSRVYWLRGKETNVFSEFVRIYLGMLAHDTDNVVAQIAALLGHCESGAECRPLITKRLSDLKEIALGRRPE